MTLRSIDALSIYLLDDDDILLSDRDPVYDDLRSSYRPGGPGHARDVQAWNLMSGN